MIALSPVSAAYTWRLKFMPALSNQAKNRRGFWNNIGGLGFTPSPQEPPPCMIAPLIS